MCWSQGQRPPINVEGGGSYGNGVFGGGMNASTDIPVSNAMTVSPWVGGGGAYGKDHGEKVREFEPAGGVNVGYRF